MERMNGIIFSDLGQASMFMALDWVQELLMQHLGYHPFPATLNVRPKAAADERTWQRVRCELAGTPLTPASDSHCGAKLFRVEIQAPRSAAKIGGAVLLPDVKDYPNDKIEIIAPVRLKDHLGVGDGDQLVVEFIN